MSDRISSSSAPNSDTNVWGWFASSSLLHVSRHINMLLYSMLSLSLSLLVEVVASSQPELVTATYSFFMTAAVLRRAVLILFLKGFRTDMGNFGRNFILHRVATY